MPDRLRRSRPLRAAFASLPLLLVVACGGSTTPTPSPTPLATETPVPTSARTASPAPTPSATVDPAADLTIAPPYAIKALDPDAQASLDARIASSLGALGSTIQWGIREVDKDSAPAGMAQGNTVTKKTIEGTPVRLVTVPNGGQQASYAIWTHDQGVMVVISTSPAAAEAIAGALISG
jgi:hypothetical protein